MVEWSVPRAVFTLGNFELRWYSLLFALGFVVSFHILKKIFLEEGKNVKDVDSVLVHMVMGTIIGARIGHCLFYEPERYLAAPWEILMIWKGGLASHGAFFGLLLSSYLYSRKHPDQPLLWFTDRICICVPLAGAMIRLGNLFNSEIIGRPTDVPWAFVFKFIDDLPRHPTQLYEAVGYLAVSAICYKTYWKYKAALPRGLIFGMMLIGTFSWRILMEFFKENQVPFEEGMSFNMGQLLSVPLITFGIVLILRAKKPAESLRPAQK